jgi:hypothetical protein
MRLAYRVLFSFCSLLLSVGIFSAAFASQGAGIFIAEVMLIFAIPGWVANLLLVFALRDAHGKRLWVLLSAGGVIGPACLGLWGFVELLRGSELSRIWSGDPLLGLGLGAGLIFAFMIGFLTNAIYVIILKMNAQKVSLHR